MQAIRSLRTGPVADTWEDGDQGETVWETEEREQHEHRLTRHRNAKIAAGLICMLGRVAPDPTLSTTYTVVQRLPKDTTTSAQWLYASMLLKAILEDDSMRADISRYLSDHLFPDGSAFIETVC